MNAPVVFSVGEVGCQGSSGAEKWTQERLGLMEDAEVNVALLKLLQMP